MRLNDEEITYIVFDTNVIKRINPKLNEFSFGQTYQEFKSFLEVNEIENIKICIPKIVIEELTSQHIEQYKKIKQDAEKKYNQLCAEVENLGWELNIKKKFDLEQKEYVDFIKHTVKSYIEKEKKLIVIDYPSDNKMKKIIERSIKKQKPFFQGKAQKKEFSDAGFKDVIFLESIIEQSQNLKGNYKIITRDKYLTDIDINIEFECNCEIKDIDTGKKMISYIENEYDLTKSNKYLKFIKSDYYRNTIESVLGKKIDNYSKNIEIREIGDDITIENTTSINDEEHSFDVIVVLSEENDFIEIRRADNSEVLHEWAI